MAKKATKKPKNMPDELFVWANTADSETNPFIECSEDAEIAFDSGYGPVAVYAFSHMVRPKKADEPVIVKRI